MGTLTKQIYRYTHKRNMRHNENLWPFVKISRSDEGEISTLKYRNQDIVTTSLSSLINKFSGSVLLTATGPSINEIDFTKRTEGILSAGVNGAWHLQQDLNFNFYFIVDMTFIDHHKPLVKEVCNNKNILLFTTVMGIVKIIDILENQSIQCQIAIIEDICYQTYKPSIQREQVQKYFSDEASVVFSITHPNIAFSTDIRKGVFDAGTVIYWALQILANLGFNTIYIAGLDLNNLTKPRFYENRNNMRPSYIQNKLHDLILPALKLASDILGDQKIRVFNLSPQSSVPESTFIKKGF